MDARQLMSDAKFYEGYSRYIDEAHRYETWEESVERVMNMHRDYYKDKMTPELAGLINFAEARYKDKKTLGAQRALQFGGKQLLKHMIRMYNCVSSHCDRPRFFQECMYMLLCGAGAGFSVQHHHVAMLPDISARTKASKTFVVPDSIEGWADAFGVLLSSYFTDSKFGSAVSEDVSAIPFREYMGRKVHFDLNSVRPKGAFISGGFKAPGPEPLRRALDNVERLLEEAVKAGQTRLRPIQAYDIVMYLADAVIAGGVRRSATICLFSPEDEEMMAAKTGDWFIKNPQRGRSNNSAVIVRKEVTEEFFRKLMKSVEQYGEPGWIFTENREFTFNPCVEIGKLPKTVDGRSGWQGCNLAEINGGACVTREDMMEACKAAAIICTLQAGYTDFKYLTQASKDIFERESLIGVSITGWMNNPDVLFNEQNMKDGAELVKYVNKQVAGLIGINPAARTTCAKPSGNASVLLGTASGIHGEHSPRYIRNVQMNKESEVAQLFKKVNPEMVEDSVWSQNGTDWVVSFPVESPEGSIYKSDLYGVKQLEYVKKAQQIWVEYGTDVSLCVDPDLRHNISNTISVDDWDSVTDYVFKNKDYFAGISFLAASGDKDYVQAPFTEVMTAEGILKKYGVASMFAGGLIVDGLHAFNDNLWRACDTLLGFGEDLSEENHQNAIKRDWVRRANKFAKNYFKGDVKEMTYCLKDVHNLHKWERIVNSLKQINWEHDLAKKEFTDIDTMGAVACHGGQCEVNL